MHELSITRDVVALAVERAGGRRVLRVALEIGRLSAVVPEAVRFCFEPCCRGTAAEGARLEIAEIPGRGRCRGCGREFTLDSPLDCCDCGSMSIDWIDGDQLRVKELEVE